MMSTAEVEGRLPIALAAVPETGTPPQLGAPAELTHSFEEPSQQTSPVAASVPTTRASSGALTSPGRQDSANGSDMGTSGSGSSAYLRVLELILEEQLELAAGDDSSASADLFAHEIVDLDAPNRCAEIDPGKEVLFYAQGGAPGSGFCLFLDNCTDQELTTVRVVAPSVPGVLASVTTAFEQEGSSAPTRKLRRPLTAHPSIMDLSFLSSSAPPFPSLHPTFRRCRCRRSAAPQLLDFPAAPARRRQV